MIFSCPFCNQSLQEWGPNLKGKITRDFYCSHLNSTFIASFHINHGNLIHFNYQFRLLSKNIQISMYANQWDSAIFINNNLSSLNLEDFSYFDWNWSNESCLQKQINTFIAFS